MARIDVKRRKIRAKLVYYGPGLCGKTTNLQYINKNMAGDQELTSLATEGDMTIFFDFMPIDLGKLRGMDIQFKLYTVPGQVRYNQTRKMVLKNVDGIVFVADSQPLMMDPNLESFDNLFENLAELGIDAENLPIILQYNKQDLPGVLAKDALDAALNQGGRPSILASAYTGDGVVETLKLASKEVLRELTVQLGPEGPPTPKPKPRPKPRPTPSASATTRLAQFAKSAAARLAPSSVAPATEESTKTRPAPASSDTPPKWFERWAADRMKQETLMRADLTLAVAGIRRAEASQKEIRDQLEAMEKAAKAAKATAPEESAAGPELKAIVAELQAAAKKVEAGTERASTGVADAALRAKIEALGPSIEAVARSVAKIGAASSTANVATKADVSRLADGLKAQAGAAAIVELGEKLASLATREDLTTMAKQLGERSKAPATSAIAANQLKGLATRTALEKLAERLEKGRKSTAEASSGTLAELPTRRELADVASALIAGLEKLPTKADIEGLERRIEEVSRQAVKSAASRDGASAPTPQTSKEPGTKSDQPQDSPPAAVASGGADQPTATGRAAVDDKKKRKRKKAAANEVRAAEAPAQKAATQTKEEASAPEQTVDKSPGTAAPPEPDPAEPVDDSSPAAKLDPAKLDPAKLDPAKADPAKAKVDSARKIKAKADSAKVEVDPAKAKAKVEADPAKVKVEVDPAKVKVEADPVKVEADSAKKIKADSAKKIKVEVDSAKVEVDSAKAADTPAKEPAAPASGTEENDSGKAEAAEAGDTDPGDEAAAEPETTAGKTPPDPEDKQHKNAARVARVMIADLYLYHRDDVEAGLREGDFDERNKEALADIRGTYQARIDEDVRKEWDHVQTELAKAKNKWRGRLGI